MDENQFWCTVWGVVATGIVAIIFSIGYFTHLSDKKIVEMVKLGASPMEARCAMIATSQSSACYMMIENGD